MSSKAFQLARRLRDLSERARKAKILLEYSEVVDPRYRPPAPEPIFTGGYRGRTIVGYLPVPEGPKMVLPDIATMCSDVHKAFAEDSEALKELAVYASEVVVMIYYYEKGYHNGSTYGHRLTPDWWALNFTHAVLVACIATSVPGDHKTNELEVAVHHILTMPFANLIELCTKQMDGVRELNKIINP